MHMYFVYALTDPRTGTVAYVGITNNAYERFKQHISYRDNNGKKHAWIQQLQQEKVMPAMKILEIVEDEETALNRERYWINYYKAQGIQLTNLYLINPYLPPVRRAAPQKHEIIGDSPDIVFSPSTPNDLWAEFTIDRSLYGEDDIVPFKRLLEWREINDEMYMSIKENGKVVAYSSLMPLEQDIILALLEDKIRERDIPLTAIQQWTDPGLSVYVASITVKPSGILQRDRELGGILIRHTVKWALSLDRQSDIKSWYGIGATKEGQHLFERLGFTEIISLYNGERKGYHIENVKQPVRFINQISREISHQAET